MNKTLCLILLCLLNAHSLFAESSPTKVALVIGVKNYKFVSPLSNTLNDAQDISSILRSKGFEVIQVLDPQSKRDIQNGVLRYFGLLKNQADAIGLIYYSGHGMQIDGSNYLIPAMANPQIKADVEEECLNMDYIMRAVEEAGNMLNIFILDACRNNPFKSFSRTAEKGLTMVAAPKGSYIVYATKPGSVASDGTERNGLFTSKLIKYINTEGLNIEQVFKNLARDVSMESNNMQRPWIASDFTGDFYFTAAPNKGDLGNTGNYILNEEFTDNKMNWLQGDSPEYRFLVRNGKYLLESKKGGSWFTSLPIDFNTNGNYEISADITKVLGTDEYYFGLRIGANKNGDNHFAGITGNQLYALAYHSANGKELIKYDATNAAGTKGVKTTADGNLVRKGNATNNIKLIKTGGYFRLFINDQLAGEAPAEELSGNFFGFQLWSGNESLMLEVDNFRIKVF